MCAISEGSGGCAVSPEPSLFAYVISTIISCAGSSLIVKYFPKLCTDILI